MLERLANEFNYSPNNLKRVKMSPTETMSKLFNDLDTILLKNDLGGEQDKLWDYALPLTVDGSLLPNDNAQMYIATNLNNIPNILKQVHKVESDIPYSIILGNKYRVKPVQIEQSSITDPALIFMLKMSMVESIETGLMPWRVLSNNLIETLNNHLLDRLMTFKDDITIVSYGPGTVVYTATTDPSLTLEGCSVRRIDNDCIDWFIGLIEY